MSLPLTRTLVELNPKHVSSNGLRPHVILAAINLTYNFKTVASTPLDFKIDSLISDQDIFSPTLTLPVESVLNEVVNHFVSLQLVKSVPLPCIPFLRHSHLYRRYPLIFGPWREVGSIPFCQEATLTNVLQQLDLEMKFVPSLVNSCLSIMKRSLNPATREKYRAYIKVSMF